MHRSPLWRLYLTRIREFFRQPARIFWVYGFPMLLTLALWLGIPGGGPGKVHVDLVDTPAAADLKKTIDEEQPGRLKRGASPVEVEIHPRDEALWRLKTGKVPLVAEAESFDLMHYTFDATRPEAILARATFDDAYQRAIGRADMAIPTETRVTEPGSRYVDWLLPGLIGVNAMGGGLWGLGYLLVNFRVGKLLKRFAATPMPRRDFLLALFGARLTFLLPDLIVLLGFGVFAVGMPIRGSIPLVILIDVVGSLAFAGIGLLIGSRIQTTEAATGLMNLVQLPMWLFSGVFFSNKDFGPAFQPIIQALPLTQLVDALRRVILEGAGLLDVWGNLAILAAWAVGTFLLALRIFKWS